MWTSKKYFQCATLSLKVILPRSQNTKRKKQSCSSGNGLGQLGWTSPYSTISTGGEGKLRALAKHRCLSRRVGCVKGNLPALQIFERTGKS